MVPHPYVSAQHHAILDRHRARTIITVGNFDGVHRGHQALIAEARRLADERGARVLALPFERHPNTVLRPEQVPAPLTHPPQQERAVREAGADEVRPLRPTPQLLGMSPERFVDELIMPHHPLAMVEGESFRFGKKRAGDVQTLRELGGERGGGGGLMFAWFRP